MYFKKYGKIGREAIHTMHISLANQIHLFLSHVILSWVRSTDIFLLLLPTIALGCTQDVHPSDLKQGSCIFTPINLYSSVLPVSKSHGGTLDILTFENDRLRRLDTYQRLDDFEGTAVHPASTGGEKVFFLCFNSNISRYEWSSIYSYGSLSKSLCNLEDESISSPTMTGECICKAGEDTSVEVRPLACQIHLETIRCDFSGTPYQSEKVKEAKVYLTNVNASCSLTGGSGSNTRIINPGMLNPHDVKGFKDRSIIVHEMKETIGTRLLKPACTFLCYPIDNFTRLVIEGKIGSDIYYWPIGLGTPDRGKRYSYNILIRRKGVSDPDTVIDPADLEFNFRIKPWTEKEEYQVLF